MQFDDFDKIMASEEFYPFLSVNEGECMVYELIFYKVNKPDRIRNMHVTVDRKTREIVVIEFEGKKYTTTEFFKKFENGIS